jgi:glycosyltransferase involved in cell wall biosynthesis
MNGSSGLRIGVLGTRGIPARYGGFETFAEELSRRLVGRGHHVTVYCRRHPAPAEPTGCGGVRLRYLPCVRTKHLETVSHTALSLLDSCLRDFEVLLFCNAANAFACALPRLLGRGVILNVDGIERMRRKWGWAGRAFYRIGERLAVWLPHRFVTDALTIQDYYRSRYGREGTFIPYGAEVGRRESRETPDALGLESGRYILFVSRLEPENNAHALIAAYLRSGVEVPLVVVGDAPYADRYKKDLRRLAAQGNVIMPGAIYGRGYRELLSHCLCYVQATEVGGTHPALVEAMAAGALVLYNDTPENREVAGEAGIPVRIQEAAEVADRLRQIVAEPGAYAELPERAVARVRECYDWERVTDEYESLMYEVVGKTR